MSQQLLQKYNVAAPRYTSYPTMPYWDTASFSTSKWEQAVSTSFQTSNATEGISIYIHLPFCENLCTYCGCNTRITKNHRVELPYIEAVLKEWEMYKSLMAGDPIIRELHLGGGTPTFFSAEHLALLIRGILKGAYLHPEAEFSFEAHPANTTAEHLQTLYNLGFRRLSLGIQDFDPAVQLIINRHQTLEQVRDVTHTARAIGYTSVNYDLIYGLPLQKLNSLVKTMHLVSELMPDRIAFYSYAHVPWVKPGQRKFTEKDLPDADTKFKLYEVGRSLLQSYGYKEIGMDHFALPGDHLIKAAKNGTLHRNFMGYTHQHTQLLIGLGVSAISDSWGAFAQNEKKLEDYLKAIDLGILPVFKGHLLTATDLAIRKHILEIMCTGKTTWNGHTEPYEELAAGIERLEPLANDGLIELCSWGLKVTETGQRFLRNICMALDARLWADQPATQLFSMAI
ncbi:MULTISPECIES: oxygen-independent coproporphyrinogen III oxidase [unclassified Mucilaginibacter]|uniref:oxygen-independent coproporphyrinogen III oxidase n=1 Tax=unclassified Mucilaginibacter TaxID=2617802 RepID=UPI00095A0857|nr:MULTISPECIES: oxygen-independent coproporphyrinogen III oxidase [unclassified Mucilaginibacter]OJW13338.1 MAG: oxygen-independent coproporphyrinogen III oxidase [Mucilaginibacter sp. 44-25]PLW89382.1 MAG: oxygen-independent coproporphyrinogen III oxidase [Mucilaginibacter sp.]HEK19105.1 oxygen-independent coproporphyrinogen III oxidase [Bacteroidota bacterium]